MYHVSICTTAYYSEVTPTHYVRSIMYMRYDMNEKRKILTKQQN